MRAIRRDPLSAGLARALAACVGSDVAIVEIEATPWASATFAGARHRFAADLAEPDAAARAAALAALLETHEFALSRHVVADVSSTWRTLEGGGVRLEIELLSIEE